ncbi:uncharacterized protein LOC120356068 isoform X2 [Nilaparvata lugens]|uniref:uncharacterized protein LOC120356068 isoform X2 n=1 Tax=Nilaparvata lugens TaxID=108931 RepID=UPI00193DC740|nr:uncharacterized protein LOC120356068 isoform X2 [Nilaparvata lugens]
MELNFNTLKDHCASKQTIKGRYQYYFLTGEQLYITKGRYGSVNVLSLPIESKCTIVDIFRKDHCASKQTIKGRYQYYFLTGEQLYITSEDMDR